MHQSLRKDVPLEILISTMYRTDLSFLNKMFPGRNFFTYDLLIINQTTEDCLLHSMHKNIRIINSFTHGLSKSRNLALQHAHGEICLIADDDTCFVPGFQERILKAYAKYPEVSAICFQTLTTQGRLYCKYSRYVCRLHYKNIKKVLSIEVSFKRDAVCNNDVVFNEHFGLGATFEDSETFFFLTDLIKKKIRLIFYPATIVIHEGRSSSDAVETDRVVHARMAAFYKLYKSWAYVLLIKYIFFLCRKRYIKWYEIRHKFMVGIKGIREYKNLQTKGLEK